MTAACQANKQIRLFAIFKATTVAENIENYSLLNISEQKKIHKNLRSLIKIFIFEGATEIILN